MKLILVVLSPRQKKPVFSRSQGMGRASADPHVSLRIGDRANWQPEPGGSVATQNGAIAQLAGFVRSPAPDFAKAGYCQNVVSTCCDV
jgi:hypothetical protein